MTDERFFTLARLHGFPPDKALREFAACVAHETHAPAMLQALQRLTHPMADDDDLRDALDVIARATGQPVPEPVPPTHATPDEISAAREMYALGSDDNIEIDDDARVSEGEGGVFVQAWVWVPAPADEPDDDDDDDDDDDEGPEPPYAGYESEAQLRRMAGVRALRAARGDA